MPLTFKQQRFVEEYVACGGNATRAAERAGYSARTANEQGAHLLAKPHVRAAVQEQAQLLTKQAGLTGRWLLDRLKCEARHAGSARTRLSALVKLAKILRLAGVPPLATISNGCQANSG